MSVKFRLRVKVTNVLAYYNSVIVTIVKIFIAQARGKKRFKLNDQRLYYKDFTVVKFPWFSKLVRFSVTPFSS